MKRILSCAVLAAVVFVAALPARAETKPVDYMLYEILLKKYVHHGVVDYMNLQTQRRMLERFLEKISQVKTDKLGQSDQKALFINAYNAWTLWLVLTRYPDLTSIKDLGNLLSDPWEKKIVNIDGQTLSLDKLEYGILASRFKDPRVFFALCNAAKGSPPLLDKPYVGDKLEQQLDEAAKGFLNNPRHTHLTNDILYVSMIFDWHAKDFPGGAVAFIKQYAQGELKERLQKLDDKDVTVRFFEYDWALNGR